MAISIVGRSKVRSMKLSAMLALTSIVIGIMPEASAVPNDTRASHVNLSIGDLQYILDQIKMAEAHALRTKLAQPSAQNPSGYDQTLCLTSADLTAAATNAFGATGLSRPYSFDPTFPLGLRQVDAKCNNILAASNYTWGAADQPFRRIVPAVRTPENPNNYAIASSPTDVYDSEVRNISNLI